MDYGITDRIRASLVENNFQREAHEFDSLIRSGTTGGEIVYLVGEYLEKIASEEGDLAELIQPCLKEFRDYAKSIGIY